MTQRITADCGKLPSENNCTMKISASMDEKDKLLQLARHHAVVDHGHADSPDLLDEIEKTLTYE